MSKSETETQASLDEFRTAREIREEDVSEASETDRENQSWSPDCGARVRCQNCEDTVSLQFARVFGNNQNEIHGCPSCRSYREMKDGAIPEGEKQ